MFKIFLAILAILSLTVSCTQKQKVKNVEVVKVETEKPLNEERQINKNKYICNVQEDKRLVQMDKKPSRCEVYYTKFGEANQVAWAEATPSICERVFTQIRSNIEGAGFKCDNVTYFNVDGNAKRETASTK